MLRLLTLLISLLLALPAAAQSVVTTDNVRAELLSEVSQVKAGEPFWVALRETMRPHWHTYWKNPGDAGQPTDIAWKLPAGVTADPIVWPAPTKIDVSGVVNYGFEGDVLLLVKITPPSDFSGSTLSLAADAHWLVCSDVCIPEEGKFSLSLPVGPAATPADPATRALFDAARRQVPNESPWPARFGVASSGDPILVVDAKGLKPDTIRDVYFFRAEWGPVANMAKLTARVSASGIRIPLK
jgi:thiol:disulfide interchange protein DsbD